MTDPGETGTLPTPFRWEGEHVAADLPGGRVLFTSRHGGVSLPPYDTLNLGLHTDDDAGAVQANRDVLATLTGIPLARTVQGHQVHGTTVRRVLAAPDPVATPADADGQATAMKDVAVLVLTADCLPVALVGADAVAMLHAGWRGLAAGVLEEGVAALRDLVGRGTVRALIGPGAGPCCYEVGDEVRAAFAGDGRDVVADGRVDLKLVARRRLGAAGVDEVHDCGLCTICDAERRFFSHRRDGGVTGRQAGVAWRS